jgi:hypothetical protein
MAILRSLILACTLALASGAAVSLLLLLALNGLAKLSRRIQIGATVSEVARPAEAPLAPAVIATPQSYGSSPVPAAVLAAS